MQDIILILSTEYSLYPNSCFQLELLSENENTSHEIVSCYIRKLKTSTDKIHICLIL